MLLRNKKTGNVYAFNKVLWDSGDFEKFAEPREEVSQPEPEKKVTRRRGAAIQPNEGQHGSNAQ